MKRLLLIITFIYIATLTIACASGNASPLMIRDDGRVRETIEEDNFSYQMEQVALTKGFQNLEPSVEILKKNGQFKVLASLGLLETSGVKIRDITKSDNEINIYVENIDNKNSNQLAIPQILIEFKGLNLRDTDDLKFNIINENYKPLSVKLSASEVINKVKSDFQIVTSTSPDINMIKEDDKLFWELNYKNILDKYNIETPVVDMSVIIDANTGELVKSTKNFISSFLDEGFILDYIPNDYILYKREDRVDKKWQNLLLYDLKKGKKEVIYSTSSDIVSAKFNPSLDKIALLESSGEFNKLYILNSKDNKTYKVVHDNPISPASISWRDSENLYILNKNTLSSAIYNYNLKNDTTDLVHYLYSEIIGMQNLGDDLVLTLKDQVDDKYTIKFLSDWIEIEEEREGFKPKFINHDYMAYLKLNTKTNNSELVLLRLSNGKIYDSIDLNVNNFFTIDDNTLGIISSSLNNSVYTFYKYHIEAKELEEITNITSDKAYYDSDNNLLYIDFKVPFESTKSRIIYSLDLNSMEITEPSAG